MNTNIMEYCTELKLSAISSIYQEYADKCAKESISHTEYLQQLLECEHNTRHIRAQQTTLQLAKFPKLKTLDMFDFSTSNVNKNQILELANLGFLNNQENIVLVGSSGTGKTHIASSIGYLATKKRLKVKFITAADLMIQLESASLNNSLPRYFSKIIGSATLLIIDEFGYINLNQIQSQLFFQLINKRYETGSIILTTNLIFTKWKEVLNNDEALTAAVLDRLLHHSHIINIQGDSYRLKHRDKGIIV